MKVGDEILSVSEDFEVRSVNSCYYLRNDFVGRVIKHIEDDKLQLEGDYSTWLYVKDFDENHTFTQYEIY